MRIVTITYGKSGYPKPIVPGGPAFIEIDFIVFDRII
jgi:hypothetical protein